jgi:hypothetical protein
MPNYLQRRMTMIQMPAQYVDTPIFYECGCCCMYHPIEFDGDCREDGSRFAAGELDEMYGSTGWMEVSQPE